MAARHGPHQVAQKSSTTTLPEASNLTEQACGGLLKERPVGGLPLGDFAPRSHPNVVLPATARPSAGLLFPGASTLLADAADDQPAKADLRLVAAVFLLGFECLELAARNR